MHKALSVIAIMLFACAVIGAALLNRIHRSGTGFLLGVFLGPVGLLIAWLKRPQWERERAAKAWGRERERKEQAEREWRGY